MSIAGFPPVLLGFLGTVALALIIGLELHAYRRRAEKTDLGFGTTRTITLIAAGGFALWSIGQIIPFCVGLFVLGLWLAIDYLQRQKDGDTSLLPHVIALLAYALGPLILTAPLVLVAALAVVMLLALGESTFIRKLSDAFPAEEGVTLAKFLILAGLVLPLLPNIDIFGLSGITYTKTWTAVLVISGISYCSYLAHRYLFPQAGTLLTGLLGGLYSSTAATVVLSRSARQAPDQARLAAASVILATAMMYARLIAVTVLLGHADAALRLALPFGFLFCLSLALGGFLAWRARTKNSAPTSTVASNPLDLPIAFLFAFLFVAFAALTNFVTGHFGASGLRVLSFAVGFSDIDPFIFSLLDGKFQVSEGQVVSAILIASGSNNLLKSGYALVLSRQRAMLPAAGWLATAFILSIAYAFAV